VTIEAASTMELKAAATMELKSAMLKLNGGGAPIARVGDVATGPAGALPIVGPGNPTVLG
jgi:hypothetical protein